MTALSSSLNFLSGLALHFGTTPVENAAKPDIRMTMTKRRPPANGEIRYTPLSARQKQELLDSIRHDDWFE